jgi:polysaccharide export outer membrane protein
MLTLINAKNFRFAPFNILLAAILAALGLAGCSTTNNQELMSPPPSLNALLAPLTVGDTVTVTMSGIPDPPLPEEKPIKGDGTISLPDIGSVQAAGKTPGELEDFIRNLYVPKIYTHLSVTVKATSDRVYFVRGEVRTPNRYIYVGPITVTKAITSAGDFTDFANRKKVVLIRNGKNYKLDCNRILDGVDPDPPVFPGDQIVVKRKLI